MADEVFGKMLKALERSDTTAALQKYSEHEGGPAYRGHFLHSCESLFNCFFHDIRIYSVFIQFYDVTLLGKYKFIASAWFFKCCSYVSINNWNPWKNTDMWKKGFIFTIWAQASNSCLRDSFCRRSWWPYISFNKSRNIFQLYNIQCE